MSNGLTLILIVASVWALIVGVLSWFVGGAAKLGGPEDFQEGALDEGEDEDQSGRVSLGQLDALVGRGPGLAIAGRGSNEKSRGVNPASHS